ncbi:hypothetical protein BB561_003607 [Smittium simulii]|uniref:Uncharacterized protein n=1 Tax=Smittium simulii TaxID=133385 RepID=A0A2T9YKC9_9FUNG|nr:hypothetical protein BB561_003607 [Smittium simulii]
MNLAGKSPQIFEPNTEPRFQQKFFNALVTANNLIRRSGLPESFRGVSRLHINHTVAVTRASLFVLIRMSKSDKLAIGTSHCRKLIQDFVSKSGSGHVNSFDKKNLQKQNSILPQEIKTEISYGPLLTMHPHRYKKKLVPKANKALTEDQLFVISKKAKRLRPVLNLIKLKEQARSQKIRISKYLGNLLIIGETKKKKCGIHIKGTGKTERAGVSDKLKEASNYPRANNHIFKPDNKSNQKDTSGNNNADKNNCVLLDGNIGLGPTRTVYSTNTASKSNYSDFRLKRPKFALLEKEALALDGLEDQQLALKNQGLEIKLLTLLFATNDTSGVEPDTILLNNTFYNRQIYKFN